MKIGPLSHWSVAKAQVGLSYFFLLGFFVIVILVGMGIIKADILNFMQGGATMVLSFWFMRQRDSSSADPKDSPTVQPKE